MFFKHRVAGPVGLAAAGLFLMSIVSTAQALTINFDGNVTNVRSFGTIDSISSNLAAGDTFSGSFTLDTSVAPVDLSGGTPGNEFNAYNGVVNSFGLTFTSGTSTGVRLVERFTAGSSVNVFNNNTGGTGAESISVLSNVSYDGTGIADLTARNVVFRFFDSTQTIVDSAKLEDVDWNNVLAIGPSISSEIAFNQVTTGFSQEAKITLTSLQVATVPLPASLALLLGGLALLGGMASRRRTA